MTHGYADAAGRGDRGRAGHRSAGGRTTPAPLIRSQEGPFARHLLADRANQSLPLTLLDAEKDVLRRYRIPSVA